MKREIFSDGEYRDFFEVGDAVMVSNDPYGGIVHATGREGLVVSIDIRDETEIVLVHVPTLGCCRRLRQHHLRALDGAEPRMVRTTRHVAGQGWQSTPWVPLVENVLTSKVRALDL